MNAYADTNLRTKSVDWNLLDVSFQAMGVL